MTARIYDGLNCAKLDRAQLERTLAGGIFGFNLTIVRPPHGFEQAMADLAPRLDFIEANADLCAVAKTVADIEAIRASGRVAIVMGAQNSVLVENDPTLLGILKRIGFRILQPTYMERNKLGCGVVVEPDTGLTEQGRKWVAEMNRLSLVIDLSHVGYKTAADVIAASKQPVIVSHGNARALCDSPRNVPDSLLRAVADKGGVIGATFFSPILRRDRRPSIEDWCDHVVHMTNLVGRDHIGFATDLSEGSYRDAEHWDRMFGPNGLYPTVTGGLGPWFNFAERFPKGFESVAKAGDVWDALKRRQFSEAEVEKEMAGNMLRAYRDIWGG
jgi:membrane dipeptidase